MNVPDNAIRQIVGWEPSASTPPTVQLRITLRTTDVKARDLISLIEIIDRAYGETSSQGLYSYAKREDVQLSFFDVRSTSPLTFIATETFGAIQAGAVWLIIGVLLKYLPEAAVKGTLAYKQYWEGREVKERVRRSLLEDKHLSNLSAEDRERIFGFLWEFIMKYRYKMERLVRLRDKHKLTARLESQKHGRSRKKPDRGD